MVSHICDLITIHPLHFSTQHHEMPLHVDGYVSKKCIQMLPSEQIFIQEHSSCWIVCFGVPERLGTPGYFSVSISSLARGGF